MTKSSTISFLYRVVITTTIILLCHHLAQAQGGTNDEMVIVKEYEAKVKDADKITIPQTLPDIAETKPTLTYKIPMRDFKETGFEPNPLKPIGMAKEKLERFNSSYFKFGFGSQLTPLVELAYNDCSHTQLHYGVFYNHLSQYGFHLRNQKFSDDEAGVYLKYYPAKMELSTAFNFHNIRTHFYGQGGDTMDGGAVRQNLRDYNLYIKLRNIAKNNAGIDFTTALRGNYMQETYGSGYEYLINGQINLSYLYKKTHSFYGGLEADLSGYQSAIRDTFRDLIFLRGGYTYNNDDWHIRAAMGIVLDRDQVYPLPDLQVEKRLYEHTLIAFAGWNIQLQKNSFQSLSTQNNFVLSALNLANTRISDLHAGVRGAYSSLSYHAMFSFKNIANMPFYFTDVVDAKRFYVAYEDRMTVLGGQVELGYNHQDIFRLLLTTDINSYSPKVNTYAWYQPVLKARLSASYNLKKKFILGGYIYGFTGYYGQVNGIAVPIGGSVDIGLSVDYLLSKRIAFFGKLNNIAHQRYQVYAGYPVYGMNGLLGIKFSF
jgi:hypothetical protein